MWHFREGIWKLTTWKPWKEMAFPNKNAWNLIFLSSQEPTKVIIDIFLICSSLYMVDVLVYVLLCFLTLLPFLFLLQKRGVIYRYTSSPSPHFWHNEEGKCVCLCRTTYRPCILEDWKKVCWWCGTCPFLDWEDNTEFPTSVCWGKIVLEILWIGTHKLVYCTLPLTTMSFGKRKSKKMWLKWRGLRYIFQGSNSWEITATSDT